VWLHVGEEPRSVLNSCQHGNTISDELKDGRFIEWLSDYYLFEKDSTVRRN
jgi:hypothetical protein